MKKKTNQIHLLLNTVRREWDIPIERDFNGVMDRTLVDKLVVGAGYQVFFNIESSVWTGWRVGNEEN